MFNCARAVFKTFIREVAHLFVCNSLHIFCDRFVSVYINMNMGVSIVREECNCEPV